MGDPCKERGENVERLAGHPSFYAWLRDRLRGDLIYILIFAVAILVFAIIGATLWRPPTPILEQIVSEKRVPVENQKSAVNEEPSGTTAPPASR